MTHSFRMPAEWEKHKRTWLAWPHHKADWPGKFAPIPWVFVEMARGITMCERLGLVCNNKAAEKDARKHLKLGGVDLKKVDFLICPTNRGWMRDCGPIFVEEVETGKRAMIDWRFNAWAKYSNWQKDNKVPEALSKFTKTPLIKPFWITGNQIVLEGGAIDVNGKGSLLTTEECLLSNIQCRNKGMTRDDYEMVFYDTLGISNTIWLGNGIKNDDTHGHIDDLARFVNANTIVTVRDRKGGENFKVLEDNYKRLKKARDERGKQLTIVDLPMPAPVVFEGEGLPASYANFLITNAAVLVPVFNDPADRVALNVLAECFPKHEIMPIYCRDLILGLGTIHCLTQQEPQ